MYNGISGLELFGFIRGKVYCMWYVYIVKCCDDSLYTGISNNLDKRISDHNFSKVGAKYTKSRRPVSLVWHQGVENRNIASALELKIKKMTRQKKDELILGG